ncbi:MAG: hypothetical protein JWP20_1163 [Roseomonas sp.]|nr:hypothetical protein [Roseomonas sp.]
MQTPRILGLVAASTLATLLTATVQRARAAEPFVLTLTSNGQTSTRSFSNEAEARTALEAGRIRTILPSYTSGSLVTGVLSVQGVPFNIATVPGSNAINVTSTEANFSRTFSGTSVASVQAQLTDFVTGKSDPEVLKELVAAVVAKSTVDVVAGNPSSLLGQSIAADFTAGTLLPGDDGGMSPRGAGWHFGIGVNAMHQETRSFTINTYSIPLAVSYAFGTDGPEVFFSAPMMISETDGETAYLGTGALGVRLPVVTTPDVRWALTPTLRWGAAGSYDSATVGQTYGAALTSDLRFSLGTATLGIANTLGYYKTRPLEYDNHRINYNLQNWGFRNGVSLQAPVTALGGMPVSMGVQVIDTRMTGDKLAIESWQEYGVFATLGSSLRVNASYMDGEHGFNGFRFGITASF